MSNVVLFNGITKLDLPPDSVLDAAQDQLETVVLIGWDKAGKLYFASSAADGGNVLWLLELARKQLLEAE